MVNNIDKENIDSQDEMDNNRIKGFKIAKQMIEPKKR